MSEKITKLYAAVRKAESDLSAELKNCKAGEVVTLDNVPYSVEVKNGAPVLRCLVPKRLAAQIRGDKNVPPKRVQGPRKLSSKTKES